MYCVKCGVKLADTEQKCPLCNTVVYHPDVEQPTVEQLYPSNKFPKAGAGKRSLSGAVIMLFMIPMVLSFFSDIQPDGKLDWFGYVAGALALSYVVVALPLWFYRPNPVIFLPCDFAAAAAYLWYINRETNGNWFFSFALPVIAGFAVIVCAVVTLLRYVGKGKLYIFGGALMAMGVFLLGIEYFLTATFPISFIGWSVYPLIVLVLVGGLLIYLAINSIAREIVERKLFF